MENIEYNEIWKALEGFEGYYEYSNKGNVKSIERVIVNSFGYKRVYPKCMRKSSKGVGNYFGITLRVKNKSFRFYIHRLVWQWHNGSIPINYEVHHIDEDKENNCIRNLKIIHSRDHRMLEHNKTYSEGGTHFNTKRKLWISQIRFKGRNIRLGAFKDPKIAREKYMEIREKAEMGVDLNLMFPYKQNLIINKSC
jgi:hypothetical protein